MKKIKINYWLLILFLVVSMLIGDIIGITSTRNNTYKDDYWDSQALIQYLAESNHISSDGYGNGYLYYAVDGSDYAISCYQRLVDKDSFQNCCRDGQVTYGNVTLNGVVYLSHEIVSWGNITYQDDCYNFTYAKSKGD